MTKEIQNQWVFNSCACVRNEILRTHAMNLYKKNKRIIACAIASQLWYKNFNFILCHSNHHCIIILAYLLASTHTYIRIIHFKYGITRYTYKNNYHERQFIWSFEFLILILFFLKKSIIIKRFYSHSCNHRFSHYSWIWEIWQGYWTRSMLLLMGIYSGMRICCLYPYRPRNEDPTKFYVLWDLESAHEA